MKNVLIASDSKYFPESAFEYARKINELESVLLTGIFLPQFNYVNYGNYAFPEVASIGSEVIAGLDDDTQQQVIARFITLCAEYDIEYRVYEEPDPFFLPKLKQETRFADLLIICSESFFSADENDVLNEYLQDTLSVSECPILLLPTHYDFPKLNIIAYDGTESSVYAIKEFLNLFPAYSANETIVFTAGIDQTDELPYQESIEHLAKCHFPNVHLSPLVIDPRKYIATWINEKKEAILICGAFGRSVISKTFRKSFIAEVIKDHTVPVFIAHK